MNLSLGQLMHYKAHKANDRGNGIQYAFIVGFNGDKVSLNLFSLGTMTFLNNIVVADSEETAEVGQCWVPVRG